MDAGTRPDDRYAGWSMAATARRVGASAWAESRLYEIIGGWAATTGADPLEAALKVYFDICSRHHAWRCELLTQRLPGRLVQAYPGEGTPQPPPDLVAPAPGAEKAMAVLAATDGGTPRLALYVRVVLPRVMVAYRSWRRSCPPASGRALQRVLGLVLVDMVSDWEDGCDLLAGIPKGPGVPELVAAATARLDPLIDEPLVDKQLVDNPLVDDARLGKPPSDHPASGSPLLDEPVHNGDGRR